MKRESAYRNIDEFAKEYFAKPIGERDINEMYKVIDNYVRKTANSYLNVDCFDEVYQTAWIGAMKAVKSYDPIKKASFKTYLSVVMKNEILCVRRTNMYRVAMKTQKPEEGMYVTYYMSDLISSGKEDYSWEDIIGEYDKGIEQKELDEEFKLLMKNCSKKQKEVAWLLYKGFRIIEISQILGVTNAAVSVRLVRLHEKQAKIKQQYLEGEVW